MSSSSEKPLLPDPPDTDSCHRDDSTEPKKSTKKKRVSFKFGLETSDDLHTVKKEPNALLVPTAPIIKKECLTRALRIARGESIIMPSRLTALKIEKFLNNDPNYIDKCNSLTFKSHTSNGLASTLSSLATKKRTTNSDDDTELTEDHVENSNEALSVRRDDESEADNDDDDNKRCERTKDDAMDNQSIDSGTKKENLDEISGNKDNGNGVNECHDDDNDNEDNDEDENDGKCSEGKGSSENGKSTNEKKFVLPKRSAHSSRVIKPNKRFVEETQPPTMTINASKKDKNGVMKKKAAKVEATVENEEKATTVDGRKAEENECKRINS